MAGDRMLVIKCSIYLIFLFFLWYDSINIKINCQQSVIIDHGVLFLKSQHLRELKPKDQKFKLEFLESSPKEKFSPLIP